MSSSSFKTSLGGLRRPRGHVNTPAGVAVPMRNFVKRCGITAAIEHFGLSRLAIQTLCAEGIVQAATLFVAEDGLRRAEALEAP